MVKIITYEELKPGKLYRVKTMSNLVTVPMMFVDSNDYETFLKRGQVPDNIYEDLKKLIRLRFLIPADDLDKSWFSTMADFKINPELKFIECS